MIIQLAARRKRWKGTGSVRPGTEHSIQANLPLIDWLLASTFLAMSNCTWIDVYNSRVQSVSSPSWSGANVKQNNSLLPCKQANIRPSTGSLSGSVKRRRTSWLHSAIIGCASNKLDSTKRIQSKKKRKKLFYYYYHHSFSSHGSGWNEWKWMHDELQTIEENDALSTEKNITKQWTRDCARMDRPSYTKQCNPLVISCFTQRKCV